MACQAAGSEKEESGIVEADEEVVAGRCSEEVLAYEKVGSDITTGGWDVRDRSEWGSSRNACGRQRQVRVR